VAPPEIAAATINTTRSNIKTQGVAAPPVVAGGQAGMAIKEQGVLKPWHPGAMRTGPVRPGGPGPTYPGGPAPAPGGASPTGPSTAVDRGPIPGFDVKLGKTPGGLDQVVPSPGGYRTRGLYLMRWGWSAAAPSSLWRQTS